MSGNELILGTEDMGKTVQELVSMGCMFVVDGDVFNATIDLLDKLLADGAADANGQAFLLQLRGALLQSSKPVRPKFKLPEEQECRIVTL